MGLEFVDKISYFIPSIKPPEKPLSLREKMMWTAGIIAVYFLLYNTYAIGVNQQAVSQPFLQLISIIFAAKIGSLITIGIGPNRPVQHSAPAHLRIWTPENRHAGPDPEGQVPDHPEDGGHGPRYS